MAEPTPPPPRDEEQPRRERCLFIPASLLISEGMEDARLQPVAREPEHTPTLCFGVQSIDGVIGGIEPHDLTVLYGSRDALTLSHLLAARAQLPLREHGLGSPVLLVDAGCSFNPHEVSSLAQSLRMLPESVLEKIYVSRAFTIYQLFSLIYGWLPEAIEEYGTRLVVVSDILRLFSEIEISREELVTSFHQLSRFLSNLAAKEETAVLVTVPQRHLSPKIGVLLGLLKSRANMIMELKERRGYLRLTLERHPRRGPGFQDIPLSILDRRGITQGSLEVDMIG